MLKKIKSLISFLKNNNLKKEALFLKKISSDDSSIQSFLESSLNFGFCNNDANKKLFHSTFNEYNSLTLKTLENIYCNDFLNAMLSFLDAVNKNLSFDLFSIINSKFKSYKTYKAASLFQFDLEKVYATYSDFKEVVLKSLKESIESGELTQEQAIEFIDSIKKEKESLNILNLKIEKKVKDISQSEIEVKKVSQIEEWFNRERMFDKEIEELSSSVIFYVRSGPTNMKFIPGRDVVGEPYRPQEWESDFPEGYESVTKLPKEDYDYDVPQNIKDFINKQEISDYQKNLALKKYKEKATKLKYKEMQDGDKLSSEKGKWVIDNKKEVIELIKKGIKLAVYNNDYIDNAISVIKGLFAKNYKTYKYYGSKVYKNFKEKEIKMIEEAVKMSDEEIKNLILNIIKEIISSPDFRIIMYDSANKNNKSFEAAYDPESIELRISYETAHHAKDNPDILLEIVSHEMLHRIDVSFITSSYAKNFAISQDFINTEGKGFSPENFASISRKMFGDDKMSERFDISDHIGMTSYPNQTEELFSIMGNLRRFFDLNNIEINKKNIKYILENKAESLPVDFKHHYLGSKIPGLQSLYGEQNKDKKNLFINFPIDKKVDFIFKALTTDYQTFSEDEIFGDVTSFDEAMALSEEEKEEKKKEVGKQLKSRILKFKESE